MMWLIVAVQSANTAWAFGSHMPTWAVAFDALCWVVVLVMAVANEALR